MKIEKKMLNQFLFYIFRIFNYKLQLLQDMVEDTAFYHCGHFWTLQYIFKWGNGDFYLGECDFLTYSTCIARSESDLIDRSGCVLLCCEETGA